MRLIVVCVLMGLSGIAQADPVQEAMTDYTDFAPYDAGIILPEQISQEIFADVVFIDVCGVWPPPS